MCADCDRTWSKLAKKNGVRLPQHATKLTTGGMAKWQRRFGITTAEYAEWTGRQSHKAFIEHNPGVSLREFVGLCLEHLEWTLRRTAPTTPPKSNRKAPAHGFKKKEEATNSV